MKNVSKNSGIKIMENESNIIETLDKQLSTTHEGNRTMIEERFLKHPRHRRNDDNAEHPEKLDAEEYEYNELEYLGLKIRKRNTPTCPYNERGEYIPRNQRQ